MTPKGQRQKRNRIPGISRYQTPRGETRWQAVLETGDSVNRTQKRKRGFRTQDEAADWRSDYLSAIRRGDVAEPSKMLFRDYFAHWLELRRVSVRPSTARAYQQSCDQLGERFAATPLSRITPSLIERTYADLLTRVQPSTARVAHRLVRMVLRTAVRDGLLTRNPADHVTLPTAATTERPTWTADIARAFLAATESDPYGDAWRILLECWLRNGELRALRWSDVDLTAGTLSVRRTATVNASGKQVTGPTKSGASTRLLSMSPALTERLRKRRHTQRIIAVEMGDGWSEDRLVFPNATGHMLHAQQICQALRATCKRLNIPYIGVHGLRHSGGSIAYDQRIPNKLISERLGHSNPAFTEAIYMHTDPDRHRELGELMGELLSK